MRPLVRRAAGYGGIRLLAGALVAVAAVLALNATTDPQSLASAAPRDDVLARAAKVKAQVDDLDSQTEILAEEFNAARVRHAELVEQEEVAVARLADTTKRVDTMQTRMSARVQNMYRAGPTGFMEVLLGASDFEAFAMTWDFLRELNEEDAHMVAELKTAKSEQAAAQKALEESAAQAKLLADKLEMRKEAIEAKLLDRKKMLKGLEAQVAELDRIEEARRAAVAAQAVRKASTSRPKTFPAPTRAPRSEVVSIAKRYLGAPYVWGADGPNSFDCSGFTMFVYRQVGVQLPRVSRDQINAGERVRREDLQPGDLVFFGSPIHHVGIYVGGGMMIHSPRTGDVVKISALHSDFVGACRP